MSRHRALDHDDALELAEATTQEAHDNRPRSLPERMFAERFLPHWGFAALTVLYVGFYASVGGAAVPQPISLGWTGAAATWFGFLIQQSTKRANDKDESK
jgi:hypothetical protein